MDSIVQWVTQIIIFLLLAAIIDLLIPRNSLKKYVKLVSGLILMLIFLKPLFYLFNFNVDKSLEPLLSQLYHEESSAHSVENLTKIQKTDIQATQHAYILEQMANQLKDIANAPLIETHQVEISTIEFLFTSEEQITYEHLEEMIVYLQEPTEQKGAVTVVDEVIIFSDEDEDVKGNDNDQQATDEIKEFLEELWEISDKKLTLKWGGGTS